MAISRQTRDETVEVMISWSDEVGIELEQTRDLLGRLSRVDGNRSFMVSMAMLQHSMENMIIARDSHGH